jgi:hypothetical protein
MMNMVSNRSITAGVGVSIRTTMRYLPVASADLIARLSGRTWAAVFGSWTRWIFHTTSSATSSRQL